jgi:aminoglycoside phosphotransferase (APT) family kinase protein
MIPSEFRLLEGIQRAVAQLRSDPKAPGTGRTLDSIELAVNELLLRQDRQFIAHQLDSGWRLAKQAHLLGNAALPARNTVNSLGELLALLARSVEFLLPLEHLDPRAKTLLAEMVDWENAVHQRRAQPPAPRRASQTRQKDSISADSLAAYFRGRFPRGENLTVSNLRSPAGGFSKTTVIFDVSDEHNGLRSLVMRAEQPVRLVFLEGADLANEYHVLQFAKAAGLPVAEPLWFEEDTAIFGSRFLISAQAPGRNFGSRVDVKETISDRLLRDVVKRLVEVHSVPIDTRSASLMASHLGHWARYRTLHECIAAQVEFWRDGAAKFGVLSSPIAVRAFGWLAHNVPDSAEPPVLIHGDFGLHNLLITDDQAVSCILDWEAVGLGDPLDDLMWLSEGLKGSVNREQVLNLYEELGGRSLDRKRLPFFDVFGSVRFAVTCPRALDLFEHSPEMGLEALDLGLRYMYYGTGGLNAFIQQGDQISSRRPT